MLKSLIFGSAASLLVVSAGAVDVYAISFPGGVKTYTKVGASFSIPTPLTATVNPPATNSAFTQSRWCIDASQTVANSDVQIRLAWQDVGEPESDLQDEAIYTVTTTLPPAAGYAVVFIYEADTWDSYTISNGSGCSGGSGASAPQVQAVRQSAAASGSGAGAGTNDYWDSITVNINQTAPYWELVAAGGGSIGDPTFSPDPNGTPVFGDATTALPGATWGFGGCDYGTGSLEQARGRTVLEFEGNTTDPYYLSFSLDTANVDASADELYPSWAVFNSVKRCISDWNVDGLIDTDDADAFVADFLASSLTADLNDDSIIDFNDVSEWVDAYLIEEPNPTCSRLCLEASPSLSL